MKKMWAALLVLLLITLSACQSSDTSRPQTNEESETTAALTQEEFWQKLVGVWVCVTEGENQFKFIAFSIDGAEYTFGYGLLASDYFEMGTVSGFEAEEGSATQYRLTVDFPAIEESMLSSGVDAHTDGVLIDITAIGDAVVIGETSVTAQGEDSSQTLEYVYYGADTYEAGENVPGVY